MKAKKIKKQLNQCRSFEEFFVKVSEIKIEYSTRLKALMKLRNIVSEYDDAYDIGAVVYLCDCIDLEIINTRLSKYGAKQ